MNYCILYNPLANNNQGEQAVHDLHLVLSNDNSQFIDITTINDYKTFFDTIPIKTKIIICGGDGTLHRFINNLSNVTIKHELLYYPCGCCNDFAHDVNTQDRFIPMNDYLRFLPVVTVNENNYKTLNGVGFGLDGYCCEVGDNLKKVKPKKKINYTSIAIKGLLFHYKPTNATIIVDGKKHYYKKVWIAPTMNGKYYGGGMMPTPKQNRNNIQNTISVMVFHRCNRLKSLFIFPSIFTGEHVKYKKKVDILSGHSITVKFDQPRTLQIDGEVITNVSKYNVKSAILTSNEKRQKRLII